MKSAPSSHLDILAVTSTMILLLNQVNSKMRFKKITDLDLKDKTVFIRTDMNVPIKDNQITDCTRIHAGLKTIEYALDAGAHVIVATHLGRPTEGTCTGADSVVIIQAKLNQLLGTDIPLITNLNTPIDFSHSKIVILENVRCNPGEKDNSAALGQKYASLCDIFVHDAFATAHRAEASTDAIGNAAKTVCAGLLMSSELEALTKALVTPTAPVVAIVGGSKVSTKLPILTNLAEKVDYLIVGGGILNTFLLANNVPIGNSLAEPDLVPAAKAIMDKMHKRGKTVPLPTQVVVATEFAPTAVATQKDINQVCDNEMILDIGTAFAEQLAQTITHAGTIIWNGPLGVFEFDQFAGGTKIVANAIATSDGFSLAGGGDTIAAINKFDLLDKIDYVSTAGGALLEFLEGRKLPAITLLEKHY